MPRVSDFNKAIKEQIPAELIARIEFPQPNEADMMQPEEVLSLVNQIDKLLSREQCLRVMEKQGCHKDEETTAPFREFGLKHADKTVDEKLKLFDELETGHKAPCHLNHDGTLSIYWGFEKDGNYQCVCRVIKRLYKERGGPVDVSSTFCGCCGGHVRHTYQYALGVKLRLKEIVSSPISSDGKKRCEFLFVIID